MAEDRFCILPFIHCHVNTKGLITPCCINNLTLGSVDNASNDFFNSNKFQNFRKLMLDGSGHKSCRACYETESNGVISLRNQFNTKYSSLANQIVDNHTIQNLSPIYLDIRFSNICNFKCRTCWHGASSSWFEDAKLLKNTASDKAIIKAFDSYKQFYNLFKNTFSQLKEVYFAGGEPLVIEEHYEFLSDLIKSERFDIELKYNSNLSNLTFKNQNLLDYWSKFDLIEFGFSIDHIGAKAELVRSGTKWDDIQNNISLLKGMKNVKIVPHITISTFNIFELDKIIDYLNSNDLTENGVYFNLLYRPFHYNIQSLAFDKKVKLQKQIKEAQIYSEYKEKLEAIIKYMLDKDLTKYQSNRIQETLLLDNVRNESSSGFEFYELKK